MKKNIHCTIGGVELLREEVENDVLQETIHRGVHGSISDIVQSGTGPLSRSEGLFRKRSVT